MIAGRIRQDGCLWAAVLFLAEAPEAVRIRLWPPADTGKRDHGGHYPENGPGSGCKPLPGLILFRIA